MFRKILSLGIIASTLLFGCSSESEKEKDTLNIGGTAFRKGDLMTEDVNLGEMAEFNSDAPGTSVKLDRSFENAPPMIPHNIDAFLPITLKTNSCVSCHMPEIAAAMKATPLPQSHMTDYRPDIAKTDGKYAAAPEGTVVKKDLKGKLSATRYNCNQCHVPQTDATVMLKNVFEADYRVEKSKSSSNLNDNITEGVK